MLRVAVVVGAEKGVDDLCRRLSYADEAQLTPLIDYQLLATPSATNQRPGGEGQSDPVACGGCPTVEMVELHIRPMRATE
jgi:hypothetical protein